MGWLALNFSEYIADLIGGAVDLLGDFLNNIFYWIVEIATTNAYVTSAQTFIVSTALGLVGLVVVKIVIAGYLLETDYDSDEDPFNLIVKVAETVAVITNAGWLFDFMLSMSRDFTNDLISSSDATGFADQTTSLLDGVTASMNSMGAAGSTWIILLFVVLIATVVFTIVAGLRGAELVAMNLFLPFFALDLLGNSRERWHNFFSAYIFAFFTYAFQILFFTIALKCYAVTSMTSVNYMIATIVWMIVAIKCPSFLEKYLYKSGVSQAASSGFRMIVQTAAMRGMIKA